MTTKVSIYARESSDDLNKSPPIEKQIERGMQWINENGYELKFIFKDDGYSGGDWKRPDWLRAIQEAKGKHYNILWTWNQDRIARDTEQFLHFYRNLKDNSIKVISDTEGEVNMDDVGGTAKHISLAMAAEIYRKVTSEKVKRTYDRKKQDADKKGIPVIWGRKRKEINMDDVVRLRNQGLGYKTIGKMLNINFQKIRRELKLHNTHQEVTLNNTLINGGS